jgi:hypothetical protein
MGIDLAGIRKKTNKFKAMVCFRCDWVRRRHNTANLTHADAVRVLCTCG